MFLPVVTLALGAIKAIFEFLSTPEGQKACEQARLNSADLKEWWKQISQSIPGQIQGAGSNPTWKAFVDLFK